MLSRAYLIVNASFTCNVVLQYAAQFSSQFILNYLQILIYPPDFLEEIVYTAP